MVANFFRKLNYYSNNSTLNFVLQSLLNRLLFIFFIFLIFSQNTLAVVQKGSVTQSPNEDNFLLVEVRLGSAILGDLIMVYQHDSGVVLPLGMITELLDLGLQVDPVSATAKGFVLDEKKSFYLNVGHNELEIAKAKTPYDPNLVLVNLDDIYVESQLLSQWMPIRFEVDLFTSRLYIKPETPLPMQLRMAREYRFKQIRANRYNKNPDFPYVQQAYKLWEMPMIDQSIYIRGNKNELGQISQSMNYNAQMNGDLLYHDSRLYVEVDQKNEEKVFRPTLGRKSIHNNLLGPLGWSEYSIGYVNSPNIPLISRAPPSSEGFMFSNYPLSKQTSYDTKTFQGELLEGWEVELYHNNALLDYQISTEALEYNFENIQLLFGNNFFKLVFYGPQGQRREEKLFYSVGDQLTKPGKFHYRLASKKSESGKQRVEATADFAIINNFSFSLAYASLEIQQQQRQFQLVAVNALLDSFFLRLSNTITDNDGSATQLSGQTRVGPFNIRAATTQFSQYVSEEYPQSSDPLSNRHYLRIDSAIPSFAFFPRVPFNIELDQQSSDSGFTQRYVSNRTSIYFLGTSLSHQFSWNYNSNSRDNINGSVNVSRRLGNHGIRFSANYFAHPEKKVSSYNLNMNGVIAKGYRLTSGINHQIDSSITRYNVGFSKNIGSYSLGFNSDYADNGVMNLSLSISTSTGRNKYNKKFLFNSQSMAKRGGVVMRSFIDDNGNGMYDKEEPLVEGAGLSMNHSNSRKLTGEDGLVFVTGITPYEKTNIHIDSATLEDPAWIPMFDGLSTTLRPGKILYIDVPIVESGEIDGTVFLSKNGNNLQAADVELEVIDSNNNVISKTKSGFDGFYILGNIPPGEYMLRINPKQAAKLALTGPAPQKVLINKQNQFIFGNDLILTR